MYIIDTVYMYVYIYNPILPHDIPLHPRFHLGRLKPWDVYHLSTGNIYHYGIYDYYHITVDNDNITIDSDHETKTINRF